MRILSALGAADGLPSAYYHQGMFIIADKPLICSEAQRDKFKKLYAVSERCPVHRSVLEIVEHIQVVLAVHGLFPIAFADGLLCDLSEDAIFKWRETFGREFLPAEYTDGILGPTTVSSILGLFLGARYRLHMCSINAPKDLCEYQSWSSAILSFKRQQKLPSPDSVLDLETLRKLHDLTDKNAKKLLGSKV
jgi:hypothetical protein